MNAVSDGLLIQKDRLANCHSDYRHRNMHTEAAALLILGLTASSVAGTQGSANITAIVAAAAVATSMVIVLELSMDDDVMQ
jgi:hypothetical protein